MPQAISIPPLIPLPNNNPTNVNDDNDDVFSTLFSPATPRGSPTTQSVQELQARLQVRHTRTSSVDSEFGSFVSVPSSEDPLHHLDQDFTNTPFTPLKTADFFDRFAEDAKAATQKNREQVLTELLQYEADPTAFLRTATPVLSHPSSLSGLAQSRPDSRAGAITPNSQLSRAASPSANPVLNPSALTSETSLHSIVNSSLEHDLLQRNQPPLMTPGSPSVSHETPPREPHPSSGLLNELLDHEDDPLYFVETFGDHPSHSPHTSTQVSESSLLDLDPLEDDQLQRTSRHPSRHSNWSEPGPARSPSLPPSAMRISPPEVQRTQSFFLPTSLSSSSSFPTRWVSSLLSRPAPAPPPPDVPVGVSHMRGATVAGLPVTHGTPFAAQSYIAPSGAPGFAGDRTWDKGFQFDKENVERASLKLLGRKEVTVPVLTVAIADKIRPYLPALKRLPRTWSLLYSLDQHGISLNTLYHRCESHNGGALLVMRDSNDAVFGAWMGDGIKLSKGAYYGSGESFLWKLLPGNELRIFKWTGKNDYVALCEPEYISFGGGDGHYGLYLDDTLSDGSSARCPTFENEPLCSAGPRQGEGVLFECVGLEVWGVG